MSSVHGMARRGLVQMAVHRPLPFWVIGAAVAVATVGVLGRTGSGGIRGVVWAEDGTVFLQQSYAGSDLEALLVNYAGYLHVAPRSMTAAITTFVPTEFHGLAVNGAAAMIQAAVAVFGFCVIRARTESTAASALVAASVVMVPVGSETSANLANVQWFLLFAGGIACLWSPGRPGRWASYAMVAAVTLSCPFGIVVSGALGLVWLLTRDGFRLRLACTSGVGSIVQGFAMVFGAPRGHSLLSNFDPLSVAKAYVVRILGDTFTGVTGQQPPGPSDGVIPGLIVAVAFLALGFALLQLRAAHQTVAIVYLIGCSVATFIPPVVLTGIDWSQPGSANRYYVAPCLYLLSAVALLLADLLALDHRTFVVQSLRIGGTAVIVLALSMAFVRSYPAPSVMRQQPVWSAGVEDAQRHCVQNRQLDSSPVPVAPAGWAVNVPCKSLR